MTIIEPEEETTRMAKDNILIFPPKMSGPDRRAQRLAYHLAQVLRECDDEEHILLSKDAVTGEFVVRVLKPDEME